MRGRMGRGQSGQGGREIKLSLTHTHTDSVIFMFYVLSVDIIMYYGYIMVLYDSIMVLYRNSIIISISAKILRC